ncbi:MAG: DegV family protein [Clostridia bacterium]|nr:DegV family protein [Clostridia bacterium]MBP5193792.1 DegV family protein [Clostridia bacterium]
MEKFVILPDVSCDLTQEILEKYDLEYVPGHISLPEGGETYATLEWAPFTREEFYTNVKKNPSAYTTSPASVAEFAAYFEKYVKDGIGVISMSISTGISGTYNFTLKAREEVLKKYPNGKIHCVDSLRFGPGFGLMVMNAAQLKAEGKSFEEVVDFIETNKNNYHQMGWLDDLSFVAKKGRLTNAKAFFGTLIGIKPIGEYDYNGLTTVLGKAKGEKQAYKVMLDYIEKTIVNPEEQIIFIAQTQRMKQAEAYRQMIAERFHPKDILILDVHPFCGLNIGPGLMAAYYFGKPISKDLSEEKAIINEGLTK